MIILSLDAVGSRDLPYMEMLPNFGKFFEQAAGCREVTSVYPSLTYPAHTSIVTGRYPAHHGIVNNLRLQPEREPSDWFWQRRYIQGTTLYDEARKKGMKTAALLWPVTGKARIRYNLPEVLPNRPWQNQVEVSAANGNVFYELELLKKFGHLRDGIRQPQLDNFVHACMLYTLKKYKPDLFLIHMTDVDTNRHLHGVESEEAKAALRRHDQRLGELLGTLEEMGLRGETDVVLLGDHYQKDVRKAIYPNYVLVKKGYVKVENGRVKDWTVLARDCDGSCYIYVKEKAMLPEARRVLEEMKAQENSGIARIFTGEVAAKLGADPKCAFMLEAAYGYYFQNGWETYRKDAGGSDHHADFKLQAATHGYLPDQEGYRTFFMAAGPHFVPGARVGRMSLVDEGPTLAAALGVDLGETDGCAADGLLRNPPVYISRPV